MSDHRLCTLNPCSSKSHLLKQPKKGYASAVRPTIVADIAFWSPMYAMAASSGWIQMIGPIQLPRLSYELACADVPTCAGNTILTDLLIL
jgi:hypothetical protein